MFTHFPLRTLAGTGALWIAALMAAKGATVTYTFESAVNAAGPLLPDSDPTGTGFSATFGSDAPPATFGILLGNPAVLSALPNARIFTNALGEANPFGTDHPLVIQSNLPFTSIRLDWMSYSVPSGGYLVISDGLGKTQIYTDDGTMTGSFFDGFSTTTYGNVAGTAFFETSAPVTSITITAWDTHDSPPGSPSVQAIAIDNLEFTLIPEPHAGVLALVGAMGAFRRKRMP